MRAILICILICLLNQFTPVECVGQHAYPGCGTVYKCYFPEICYRAVTLIQSEVMDMRIDELINDDCPAIFRFHAYSSNWVHVSIESFEQGISSIIFRQIGSSENREFSCTKTGTKIEGKYGDKVYLPNFDEDTDTRSKLSCSFIVKTNEVFLPDSTKMQFKVNIIETKKSTGFQSLIHCNPLKLKYNKEVTHSNKKYEKVSFKPGKFYCDNPDIYKLEFKKGKTSEYEPVRTFDCDSQKFVINTVDFPEISTIDIRCAAEAKYFCDYKPKAMVSAPTVSMQPYLSPPSVKIKELKCPDTHPHLIVDQMKPFMDVEFECLNYNGELYWTVNKTTRLTKDGPGIYCTNEVKCQLLFKLSESSVENGKLTVEGLPACYNERGKMFVNGDKVNSSRCDTSTGELKYRVDGKPEQVIREETHFKCITPDVEDTEQNAKNNKVLASSAAGFFGGAAILGIAIVAGVVFYTNRQFAKRQKRLDETFMQDAIKEEIMWKEHCMDKQEEKEYEDKREAERAKNEDAPASAPCVDPTKLNDTIMAALIIGVKSVSRATDIAMDRNNNSAHSDNNDAVKLRGLAAEKILPSTSVTPGFDAYKMLLLGSYIRKVDDWENE